jgi:hypothetical protein
MGTATAMSARSLQYYVIALRWVSDLEFFNIETAFLHRLIDEYFIRLSDKTYFEKLKLVRNNLLKLEKDKSLADSLLTKQLKQVELMAEDIVPEKVENLTANQVQLEYLMADITNEYRAVKKELFALIENICGKINTS